jgi:hypothetical protein
MREKKKEKRLAIADLDRVEPAKGGKRQKQEDGARGPLCERVAFGGGRGRDILTGVAWGRRSRLCAEHFGKGTGERIRGRGRERGCRNLVSSELIMHN